MRSHGNDHRSPFSKSSTVVRKALRPTSRRSTCFRIFATNVPNADVWKDGPDSTAAHANAGEVDPTANANALVTIPEPFATTVVFVSGDRKAERDETFTTRPVFAG